MGMADWIEEQLTHRIEMATAYDFHERWWGTPCGPTLSMTRPSPLEGLQQSAGQEITYTIEPDG